MLENVSETVKIQKKIKSYLFTKKKILYKNKQLIPKRRKKEWRKIFYHLNMYVDIAHNICDIVLSLMLRITRLSASNIKLLYVTARESPKISI